MQSYDLIIIGAGPAGMAAAKEAAERGLSVVVLDEQPRAGGQIFRDVEKVSAARARILGPDYLHGKRLTDGLSQAGITHIAGAVAWAIEDGFYVSYTQGGKAAQITGARILLATGALERPMPIPGWTLPGVMTAGAGQILLKQSGIIARRAVLAGSGPLLYLIAAQMVRAGTPPLALIETQTMRDFITAQAHLFGALRGWRYLLKGAKLLAEIRKADVPRYRGVTDLRIDGEGQAEAVAFSAKGRRHRIACDTVMLHHGVVPNQQAARSLNVPHRWNPQQRCFAPVVDGCGATGVEGVYIAGDGAGIGGAEVAEVAGRIAALKVAADIGKLSQADCDAAAVPFQAKLAQAGAVRPFLDAAYPPFAEALSPSDATIVCRCEEVTAGDIRGYAKIGCLGPNQTKAFGRAGMGPCQGRYCGLTVTGILAEENRKSPDETGYYRIRPPLKPVTLGELAAMDAPCSDAAE